MHADRLAHVLLVLLTCRMAFPVTATPGQPDGITWEYEKLRPESGFGKHQDQEAHGEASLAAGPCSM